MKQVIAATVVLAAVVTSPAAITAGIAQSKTTSDARRLKAAESHVVALLGEFKDTPAWRHAFQSAVAGQNSDIARLSQDFRAARTQPKAGPTTTIPPSAIGCYGTLNNCIITITKCSLGQGGMAAEIGGTITNYDRIAEDYIISAMADSGEFSTAGGGAQVNDVNPGQTAPWSLTAQMPNQATAPPTCMVVDLLVEPAH